MPTGLLIRDFVKVYREVRYSNQGSIRLSEIEHNAYLNRLTLEITHFDSYRSINYKTLPDNTHWGYLTSFKGSSVTNNLAVKFAKQRVFEHINQGIWNYHSAEENVRLTKGFSESAANSILESELLEEAQTKAVDFYLELISNLPEQIEEDLQWILSFTYRGEGEPPTSNQDYTAFPVASPFPDVFKFLSDIPCSFLFRLESWYLVNPAIYITSNPTDTSDETEDESEYPTPEPGDGSGQGQEFPPAGAPDPGSDPRDFADDVGEPGTGVWTFTIGFSDPGNNPACNNIPAGFFELRGFPDEEPQREFTGPPTSTGGRPGRFFTSVDSFTHSGDCALGGPGSPTFTADGPGT